MGRQSSFIRRCCITAFIGIFLFSGIGHCAIKYKKRHNPETGRGDWIVNVEGSELCQSDGTDCPAGGGSGDVTAAANLADNAIIRGDGGVKGVQDSTPTISDSGIISNVTDPVNSQDVATKEYHDIHTGGTAFDFSLSDTADGSFSTLFSTPTGDAQSTDSVTAASATSPGTLIEDYITESGEPTFVVLSEGIYDVHIHAEVNATAGTDSARILFELYSSDSAGANQVLLMTSEESAILTTAETEYDLHASKTSETLIGATDRLVLKVYALLEAATGQTDPVVTITMEGAGANDTQTRLTVKTTATVFDDRYLKLDGSKPMTGDLTLGGIVKDNDDMVFEIDADDNGSNSYIWTDGASTQIATLSEAGAFQIADDMIVSGGDITFGNITARIGDSVTDSVSIVTDGGTVVMDGNINSSTLTISEILITDGSKNIVSAPVATYPSLAELAYVKGVTSAIQGQIDSKTGDQVIPWEADKTIETPTDADNFIIVPKVPAAITITDIRCIVEDATSATIRIDECDSACNNCAGIDGATTIVCDVDGQDDDGSLSNAGIDADDCLRFVVTAVNGTVGQVAVSIIGTRD